MKATARPVDFNSPESAKALGGELAEASLALAQRVRDCRIADLAGLEQAVVDRQTLGDTIKKIEAFFAPFKRMAHELHKALCARESEIIAPLLRVDGEKRRAISDYKAEQDRIRLVRERELAEQAHREAQERAAAEAAAYERAGEREMAHAIIEEAIAAPEPVIALPDATKAIEGLSFRRRYLWRYAGGPAEVARTPPHVLARALETIPRAYLCVDEKKISAYARSMRGTGAIPGIEFFHLDDPVR